MLDNVDVRRLRKNAREFIIVTFIWRAIGKLHDNPWNFKG
jgi:hypothetical protein